MERFDFYKLGRAVQDRFVGSASSGFPPLPLAVQRRGTPTVAVWLAISAVALIALFVTMLVGFGALSSALSLHSGAALLLYLTLTFVLAFGVLQAVAHVVRVGAQPFAPGVYLFSGVLVDATTEILACYPLTDLATTTLVPGGVRLAFHGGAAFVFALPHDRAEALVAEVERARSETLDALASDDPGQIIALDPLRAPRFSSPVGPRDPYAPKLPPWRRHAWAVGAALAVVVAPTLWGLRNYGSDARMYADARAANTVESYRAYLARGRRFRAEVEAFSLPRAELAAAEASGTAAVVAYREAHGKSKIKGEIDAAFRKAMVRELTKAQGAGTLGALTKFRADYPGHGLDRELAAAVHAVYARALSAYLAEAPKRDQPTVAFMERLFAYAEKAGPDVEVRVRQRPSTTLARADKSVSKSSSFMGEVSYPSHYFEEAKIAPYQKRMIDDLTSRLRARLPGELFAFRVGAPFEELPARVTVPTIFVQYAAEWSMFCHANKTPRGVFCGMTFPFDVQLSIPGDAAPTKRKIEVFRGITMSVLKAEEPGPAEARHYDSVTRGAFEMFVDKLMLQWFREAKR